MNIDDPVFEEIKDFTDDNEVLKFAYKRGYGPGPAKELLATWKAYQYIKETEEDQKRIDKLQNIVGRLEKTTETHDKIEKQTSFVKKLGDLF